MIKIVREKMEYGNLKQNYRNRRFKFVSKTDKRIVILVKRFEDDPDDILIYRKEYFIKNHIGGHEDFFYTTIDNAHVDFSLKRKRAIFNYFPKDTFFYYGRKQIKKIEPHIRLKIIDKSGEVELNFEDWRKLRFEIDELFMIQRRDEVEKNDVEN